MAHTGIFATSAECDHFTPAQVSSVYTAEAYRNTYCTCSESLINDQSNYNFSDVYSSLNVDVKKILTMMSCCIVSIITINGDKSGFFSENEALNSIEFLLTLYNQGLNKLMKDKSDGVSWVSGTGVNP